MSRQSFLHLRYRLGQTSAGNCIRAYCVGGSDFQDVGQRLLECYRVLDLPQTCTKDELKSRYLDLAKRYHPDTGGSAADVDAFRRLHGAYKYIVENDYGAKERQELENVPKIFDIRHTAPQHRQYLEFGGVGHGTPSQRMRQYQQHRVTKAAENVNEYIVNKLMAKELDTLITKTAEEREYARKWKTRTAVDRLVEDLIQESMRRGEFENLSGVGKPLPYDSHNPYLDSMTHKLNQVLIQNGFCPEWVLMEKEIRTEIRRIKDKLAETRKKVDEDHHYLSHPGERERFWNDTVQRLRDDCAVLNKRIDSFNLLVPSLHKQMVHFSLDKELKKVTSITGVSAAGGEAGKSRDKIEISTGSEPTKPIVDNGRHRIIARMEEQPSRGQDQRNGDCDKPTGVFRMLFDAFMHAKVH